MRNMIPRAKPFWKTYIGPLILALVVLVFPLLARGDYAYLIELGRLCGVYVIIVVGLTLLMGYTGQVSLGHAGFYALGAYIPAVLVNTYHWPLTAAVLVGLTVAVVVSAALASPLLRLRGNHLALATLCVGIIIGESVAKFKITGGVDGIVGLPQFRLFGFLEMSDFRLLGVTVDAGAAKLYVIWAVVWVCVTWALQLVSSPGGRVLRAVEGDEDAAQSLGIDTYKVKVKVFVVSCTLAALAGVLYAFVHTEGYLAPEAFGLWMNVQLVMMVVIGGMGSIWGGVAGGVILTGLHEIISLVGSTLGAADTSRIEHIVFGLLLGVILILSPSGMIPGLRRLARTISRLWTKDRTL